MIKTSDKRLIKVIEIVIKIDKKIDKVIKRNLEKPLTLI